MTDVDGRAYIYYVGSWADDSRSCRPGSPDCASQGIGSRDKLRCADRTGTLMAEEIIDAVPSIEMVRMVTAARRPRCLRFVWRARDESQQARQV